MPFAIWPAPRFMLTVFSMPPSVVIVNSLPSAILNSPSDTSMHTLPCPELTLNIISFESYCITSPLTGESKEVTLMGSSFEYTDSNIAIFFDTTVSKVLEISHLKFFHKEAFPDM